MTKESFIKSLIFVAVATIILMFCSKFIIEIYSAPSLSPSKTLEYSSQKSQDDLESR